jgi:hypothetical protein
MARRNPDDRLQQRIAWHELGHALAWDRLLGRVKEVVHTGSEGWCSVRWPLREEDWRAYAIGLMAGIEGEKLWEKHHGGLWGNSSHWAHDIARFTDVTDGQRFSQSQARSEARRIIRSHRAWFEQTAPKLITAGRLTGSQI